MRHCIIVRVTKFATSERDPLMINTISMQLKPNCDPAMKNTYNHPICIPNGSGKVHVVVTRSNGTCQKLQVDGPFKLKNMIFQVSFQQWLPMKCVGCTMSILSIYKGLPSLSYRSQIRMSNVASQNFLLKDIDHLTPQLHKAIWYREP